MSCYYCGCDCETVACMTCAPDQELTDYKDDAPLRTLEDAARVRRVRESLAELGIPRMAILERDPAELEQNERAWFADLNRPEDDADERAAIQGET